MHQEDPRIEPLPQPESQEGAPLDSLLKLGAIGNRTEYCGVGIQGVSPRLGIGPTFILEREQIRVPDHKISPSQVAAELSRFSEIAESCKQRRRAELATENHEPLRKMFEFQLMVFDDPEVLSSVRAKIKAGHNVASAVVKAFDAFSAMLATLGGTYLEKVQDVTDIKQDIVSEYLGLNFALVLPKEKHALVAENLTPFEARQLNPEHTRAVVIGRTLDLRSHTAEILQNIGIPAVHGLSLQHEARNGEIILVDGRHPAQVIVNPDAAEIQSFLKQQESLEEMRKEGSLLNRFTRTLDGVDIKLWGLVTSEADVSKIRASGIQGIGLVKTEFLLAHEGELQLGSEHQMQTYASVLKGVMPGPAYFRTLDVKADKSTAVPDDFLTQQIEALLRAHAETGNARIFFPMVTDVPMFLSQLELVWAAFDRIHPEVEHAEAFRKPLVGCMFETPESVRNADKLFEHANFGVLGTRDLTRALRGDNPALFYDPVVLRAVESILSAARRWEMREMARLTQAATDEGLDVGFFEPRRKQVLLAGAMVVPQNIPLLLGLGAREFVISSTLAPEINMMICTSDISRCKELAVEMLRSKSALEAQKISDAFLLEHRKQLGQ